MPRGAAAEILVRELGFVYNQPSSRDARERARGEAMRLADLVFMLDTARAVGPWQRAKLARYRDIRLPAMSPQRLAVVQAALWQVGQPYIWGGDWPGVRSPWGAQGHGGFDCSGLVWWAFKGSTGPSQMSLGSGLLGRTADAMAFERPAERTPVGRPGPGRPRVLRPRRARPARAARSRTPASRSATAGWSTPPARAAGCRSATSPTTGPRPPPSAATSRSSGRNPCTAVPARAVAARRVISSASSAAVRRPRSRHGDPQPGTRSRPSPPASSWRARSTSATSDLDGDQPVRRARRSRRSRWATPDDVAAAVAGARRHLGAHPAVERAEVLERAARAGRRAGRDLRPHDLPGGRQAPHAGARPRRRAASTP